MMLCPVCGHAAAPDDRFCPKCGASLPGTPTMPARDAPVAPVVPPEVLEAKLREALAPGFLLVRRLGAGGMGSVFLAREPALKRLVAVKVLAPELTSDPGSRARFEREAQAVAAFSHPNVVGIHGVGALDDGTPYFVMQFVSGRSMAARIEEEGPLDPDEARRIIGEVASALAAAHAKGIIHRDIKPANILYDDDSGRAMVSDFGIAAVRARSEAGSDTRLTQTGMIVGTPQYMSPEALLAEEVTERTDVYALGLLGYELLAGKGPFEAATPQALIAMHLRDTPPRLSGIRKDMDPELERLVMSCLEKEPAKRPTAADLAKRLAPGAGTLLEWPPPGLDALHGRLRRHARTLWMASGALAGAILGFLLFGVNVAGGGAVLGVLLLTVPAVLGGLGLLTAATRLERDVRKAVRAVRAGFTWLTVAETAADTRGDAGTLISGGREYAALDPGIRNTLRRARIIRELLMLVGGVLPLPMLVVAMWLGSRGVAGAAALPWLIFGPSLFCLIGAATLEFLEARAVGEARRQSRARRQPGDGLGRLVEPWYASFDSVREGQALGRGRAGGARIGWITGFAVSVLALLAVVVLAPVLYVSAAGASALNPRGTRVFARLTAYWRGSIAKVASVRDLALTPDSTITPLEAGRALHALSRTPHTARNMDTTLRLGELPVEVWLPPWPSPGDSLFPEARPRNPAVLEHVYLVRSARRRPTEPEREVLLAAARHPAWPLIERVARAPAVDAVGGSYAMPFGPAATSWGWERAALPGRYVTELAILRAVWHLQGGHPDSAALVLRTAISFGLHTLEGLSMWNWYAGTRAIEEARDVLIDVWELAGRPDAQRLRARRDSVSRVIGADTTNPAPPRDPVATRRDIAVAVADTTRPLAMRFSAAQALAFAPCTNARELIFGFDDTADSTLALAMRELPRFPAESALVALIQLDVERVDPHEADSFRRPRLPARLLQRAAAFSGAVLGNRRVPNCVAVVRSRQR